MTPETETVRRFALQERVSPSRPYRLGTRRRRPHQAAALPEAGASRSRKARATSLDTEKHLATSVANWLEEQETPHDTQRQRERLWWQLCESVYRLWQDAANQPKDEAEAAWWAAYEAQTAGIKADENPEYDAWLGDYVRKHGLPDGPESYLRTLYLENWKKQNRPVGRCAQVFKWEKQYFQLLRCQGEWVGYRAGCCLDKTRPIAVPIGCHHRQCALCNWQRSEKAQRKCKTLFDRLTHPQFITVTVPNVKAISKRTFHLFRKRVRQFIAQHKEMFHGGVYAIETTYNRTEKSWHIHAHVLVDATFTLPKVTERVEFAGRNINAFTFIKRALEYDWSRLWCKELGKRPRKNAARNVLEGERWAFEEWYRGCQANALKEWTPSGYLEIAGLSQAEVAKRTAWNKANRRVLDLKPVTDRAKAAREVLKYITKPADFCDLPQCVAAFADATKGARLIQTFGTWFGVNFDADFDPEDFKDWSHLRCACGINAWERIGTFNKRDTEMGPDGRHYLKRPFDHNSAGTVPRPTIRALDSSPEQGVSAWEAR